jgi:hypothetical protein
MNKRYLLIAVIVAALWMGLLLMLPLFPTTLHYLPWVMSGGGMVVGVYNYLMLIHKIYTGEYVPDFMAFMFMR